jgi:hypothetical protein
VTGNLEPNTRGEPREWFEVATRAARRRASVLSGTARLEDEEVIRHAKEQGREAGRTSRLL